MKKKKGQIAKSIKKKIIIGAVVFLLPYVLLFFIFLLVLIPGGGIGGIKANIVNGLNIPYKDLIAAEKVSGPYNINFPLFLYYLVSETTNEEFSKAMPSALERALQQPVIEENEKETYDLFVKAYGSLSIGPIPERLITIYKHWNGADKGYDVVFMTDEPYVYTSSDDFGNDRTYGEVTEHEGNDLMAARNVPIVSMTDGTITKKGWNEYGGYRVGVESKEGTYFYYAHMERYADNIYEGQRIKAGQVIGYVGDSGQGDEGTTGLMPTHLHLQIGLKIDDDEEYLWLNPYNIVKFLDSKRITLTKEVII